MTAEVAAAVLCSAFLHACASAIFKLVQADNASSARLCIGMGLFASLLTVFFDKPRIESLPFLLASAFLQMAYYSTIGPLLGRNDFAAAYTSLRGMVPVFAVFSASVASLTLPSVALSLGMLLISAGIVLIGMGTRTPFRGMAKARAAAGAVLVIAYSAVDAAGAAASGTPFGYACWLFVFTGIIFACMPSSWKDRGASRDIAAGLLAGTAAIGSYGTALWAMTKAPFALVASLRESSVVFAVLLSVVLFRERLGLHRAIGAAAAVAGGILVRSA